MKPRWGIDCKPNVTIKPRCLPDYKPKVTKKPRWGLDHNLLVMMIPRWGINYKSEVMMKQTSYMKPPTHKQRTATEERFGTVSRKTMGLGWGLKPVLLARNLTPNSDAAPNYNHLFGPHRDHLPHLLTHCILNRFSHTMYWKSPISVLGTSGYEIYIFLKKNGWTICKKWRTWSDAAFCGVWSGSALFANDPFTGLGTTMG